MKRLLLILTLVFYLLSVESVVARETPENRNDGVHEQVSALQERMLNDTEILTLILELQSDPEMQELLKDPSLMNAISNGDINTLTGNPRFMRLLENARVKEIQRRLEP